MATAAASTKAPTPASSGGQLLINGVKAIADVNLLPGSSLIAGGEIKSGVLHALGGLVAGALLGPIGWIAVGGNAASRSITGKHLHQHFVQVEKVD